MTTAPVETSKSTEDSVKRKHLATADVEGARADQLPDNDDFWSNVRRAYDVDRSLINLNNGVVAPVPRVVLDVLHKHVEFTNRLPARHLWDVQNPRIEIIRKRLAGMFGCDPEEIALTRNASESLETCLLGIDLKPGDEILTTSIDYPRMLDTLEQRRRRHGVVIKTFDIPTPPQSRIELATLFDKNITERTRIILVSHVSYATGQVFPVKEIVQLGRSREIEVIVDGAHSFGHIPFTHSDLDCDYFATSLHKWISAPIGTGLLYVRKAKIADLWPLMAAPADKTDDIRKFEEIGTRPAAPYLAIGEALDFHESIGQERKSARLRYLRDRWAKRLSEHSAVTLFTNLDPSQSCGIATFGIDGLKAEDLRDYLLDEHRILVAPIEHELVNGIRVTPNTYTTPSEIDKFSEVIEQVIKNGLPNK